MSNKKYPHKEICEELEGVDMTTPENYGFVDKDIWYPNEAFLEETHSLMISKYGGHDGHDVGLQPFQTILEKCMQTNDLFCKAAIFLRDIITTRMYEDGNHRTGLMTCETFLNQNGEGIWTENPEILYRFIKDILKYTYTEISEWLKNGPKT